MPPRWQSNSLCSGPSLLSARPSPAILHRVVAANPTESQKMGRKPDHCNASRGRFPGGRLSQEGRRTDRMKERAIVEGWNTHEIAGRPSWTMVCSPGDRWAAALTYVCTGWKSRSRFVHEKDVSRARVYAPCAQDTLPDFGGAGSLKSPRPERHWPRT